MTAPPQGSPRASPADAGEASSAGTDRASPAGTGESSPAGKRNRPALSLKARALRYLSQREHSRLELARKLGPYVQEGDDLEALLKFLEANKWLSQERFSESLVHRRAARFGNSRIMAELASHGIKGEALQEVKVTLVEGEAERASAVWQRKFGTVATDAAERSKQTRFLLQRGFSQRAIRIAMQGTQDDDLVDA